jgi:hypothetical protein
MVPDTIPTPTFALPRRIFEFMATALSDRPIVINL